MHAMFERFRTPREAYDHKLGAALRMERGVIEIFELGVRNSRHPRVKELLSVSLVDARAHLENLESVFLLFGWEASDSPCPPMEALEKECKQGMRSAEGTAAEAIALEAALEASHVKAGVYETLIVHADAMARPEVADRLQQSLDADRLTLDNARALLAETLRAEPTRPV